MMWLWHGGVMAVRVPGRKTRQALCNRPRTCNRERTCNRVRTSRYDAHAINRVRTSRHDAHGHVIVYEPLVTSLRFRGSHCCK